MTKYLNYIGSKHKLLPFIEKTINLFYKDDLSHSVFCDLFAGSNSVGAYFKDKTKTIISNDIEDYSFVLAKTLIQNNRKIDDNLLLDLINASPQKGFIYEEYSKKRTYFTEANAQKIDGIRFLLEKIKKHSDEYWNGLSCLLLAADKVANTTSVYGACLKQYKVSALKSLELKEVIIPKGNVGRVYKSNSNELINFISGNILYMDPPYNSRQYGANYHLLNTICLYDNPKISEISGLRDDYNKSKWSSKKTALSELDDVIKKAQFDYVLLSYNNEGLIPQEEIKKIFEKYGKYDCEKQLYQRYKADNDRNNLSDHVYEYIHICKK